MKRVTKLKIYIKQKYCKMNRFHVKVCGKITYIFMAREMYRNIFAISHFEICSIIIFIQPYISARPHTVVC